jgi:hypothetical protein
MCRYLADTTNVCPLYQQVPLLPFFVVDLNLLIGSIPNKDEMLVDSRHGDKVGE